MSPTSETIRCRSRLMLLLLAVVVLGPTAQGVAAVDGAAVAAKFCISCHGDEMAGGRAPGIRGAHWRRARTDAEAMRIILDGRQDLGMPSFKDALSAEERGALIAYLRTPAPEAKWSWWPFGSSSVSKSIHSELQEFRLEQVAAGFEVPWSIAFLPDRRMLVTERAGRLRIVNRGETSAPIAGIPRVWYRQDGGLLSLALDPEYNKNGWVYLSFSDPGRVSGTSMTKIVRGRITDGHWIDEQVVWEAPARFYHGGDDHYGCRLLFHDGKLFFTVGERGYRRDAQDLSTPSGKIHRINPDGTIPRDNPFVGRADAYPSIWSYGHRNPQGLAIDPRTGELWATEHGPMGGDELNHIRAGQNYGWPVVTFGREHSGAKISDFTSKPGMIDPVTQWTPSLAVCPLHFCTGDFYPKWKNQFLVGSLSLQEFRRVAVDGDREVHQETLFKGLGRIRDIQLGPDGYLYLAIEQRGANGQIMRLMPVK